MKSNAPYTLGNNLPTVDATATLQAELNACGAIDGTDLGVELLRANYLTTEPLIVPPGVVFNGVNKSVVNHAQYYNELPPQPGLLGSGTVMCYTGTVFNTESPFSVSANSYQGGMQFYDMDQAGNDSPPPMVRAPVIKFLTGANAKIENVSFFNSYIGFDFGDHYAPRVDGYGGMFFKGVWKVDGSQDIGRISNGHAIWDGNYQDGGPMYQWMKNPANQCTAYDMGRCDEWYLSNLFCYGYWRGFYFHETANGGPWVSMSNCGTDGCVYGLYITGLGANDLLISTFSMTGGSQAVWSQPFGVQVGVSCQPFTFGLIVPPSGPTLNVVPTSANVVAGGGTVSITATLTGSTAGLTASVTGDGTIDDATPTSGVPFTYTPPPTGTGTDVVTNAPSPTVLRSLH
jgi:hypothetical protein